MLKLLVSMGADVCFKNIHGEDMQTCLREGCENAVKEMPDNAIFIRPRFEECAKFIERRKQWVENQKKRESVPRARAYRPRMVVRTEAATTIKRWWLKVRKLL